MRRDQSFSSAWRFVENEFRRETIATLREPAIVPSANTIEATSDDRVGVLVLLLEVSQGKLVEEQEDNSIKKR